MQDILYIGQWRGFFKYGPDYGEMLNGEEAEFRLFIESYNNGQFSGRVIDWEGVGVNGEVSKLNGFLNDNLIKFTKEYSYLFVIDEWGNSTIDANQSGHTVFYEGNYDQKTKCFYGSWKIEIGIIADNDSVIEVINSGSWRMSIIE